MGSVVAVGVVIRTDGVLVFAMMSYIWGHINSRLSLKQRIARSTLFIFI
jgi:hypothetical protein